MDVRSLIISIVKICSLILVLFIMMVVTLGKGTEVILTPSLKTI